MEIIVNEKSTAYLTVTFKDKGGNEEAPDSATYRVDDVDSDTPMKEKTALSVAASVEIKLEPSVNAIVNPDKTYEIRRVTIEALYGASDGVNDEYDYRLKNLAKVS